MKIDPSQAAGLLERMREAAGASATDGPSAIVSQHAVEATEFGPLEARVRAAAEQVLAGAVTDAAAVRAEIVEQILRARWEDTLPAAEVDRLVEETAVPLAEDPEFMRQVDEMLILAARKVGR